MPPNSKAGQKPAKATKPAVQAKSKPAAEKPKKAAAAKPAAAKPAAAKPAAKSTAGGRKPAAKPAPAVSPEQRRYYVEVAAYYIAERRGFHGGSEFDDWVQAEAEIDRLLREGVLKP